VRRATRTEGLSDDAIRVYDAAIVIDAHNDMATRVLDDGYDPDVRHEPGFDANKGHIDFPRLVESGVTAAWMAAWVDATYAQQVPDGSFARAMSELDVVRAWVDRHRDTLRLSTTAGEVTRAKADGLVAILLGVEGGHAIENSLARLHDFYAHGVRYLTLTWNNGNDWAGSSIGVDGTRTAGLTAFGRTVVAEMNRLGMLIDVSHASDATLADVLAVSTAPIVASHSCARAINDHPRNLTDDQLRAIANAGGVVNVNFYSRFLDPAYLRATQGLDREAQRALAHTLPATPFRILVDHIDHMVHVAGIDHVGIGSDFDGVSALPSGMEDITALPRLSQALLDRGHKGADVARVLGGNMLRLMRAVLDRDSGATA
jgi:membrane dipeptidase